MDEKDGAVTGLDVRECLKRQRPTSRRPFRTPKLTKGRAAILQENNDGPQSRNGGKGYLTG